MSSKKHTPGKWILSGYTIVAPLPDKTWAKNVASVYSNSIDDPEADANAARIVSCVNAMEGIENPEAMAEVFRELRDALSEASNIIKAERTAFESYDYSSERNEWKSLLAKASKILGDV